MKKLIAKLLKLYTWDYVTKFAEASHQKAIIERREYYQEVLECMHLNGTLPPNCDLKLPKATLRIVNTETGIVLAEDGKWKQLPADGEKVTISYKHD